MKAPNANTIISNSRLKKLASIIIRRLEDAIENAKPQDAKTDLELLEKLQKMMVPETTSPVYSAKENRERREKIIREIEEKIAKINKNSRSLPL